MSLDLFPSSSHAAVSASLLVRDVAGSYRAADPSEVVQAALRVLEGQLRGSEVLSSPQAVRDFLRIKLGTLEHEVFAVIGAFGARHRRARRRALQPDPAKIGLCTGRCWPSAMAKFTHYQWRFPLES